MFKRDDWLFGLLSIAVGAVTLASVAGLTKIKTMDPAGPAAMPKIIAWMMIGIGLMHIVGSLLALRKSGADQEKKKAKNNIPVILISAAGFLYYLFLESVGYPLLTPFLIAAVMLSVGDRNVKRVCAAALGLAVVLFVAFHYGLGVRMPLGVLEPLFG